MKYYEYTNIGPRRINEDSYFTALNNNELYVCVADGVGGLKNGEIASQFVTKKFSNNLNIYKNDPLTCIIQINSELIDYTHSKFDGQMMGTTFTSAFITPSLIKGVHVGDSRVCILRGDGIKQLTEEHNEAGRLLREGKLNISEKANFPRKNIIEHIMGDNELFNYQEYSFNLHYSDRIIISTDGFHETLSKKEIRDISKKYKSFQEFNRHLIIEIENRILRDNTTFISIEI